MAEVTLVQVGPSDNLRLLGALVDIVVSCAMFALMIAAGIWVWGDGDVDFGAAIVFALPFWAADVVMYAWPLSRYGWSIGNLLTRRRVVDRASGSPLPFKRAVVRYFARRWGALRFRYEIQARQQGSNDGLSTADRIVDSVVIKNIVFPSDEPCG